MAVSEQLVHYPMVSAGPLGEFPALPRSGPGRLACGGGYPRILPGLRLAIEIGCAQAGAVRGDTPYGCLGQVLP